VIIGDIMNYTKYVLVLVIFNCILVVLGNMQEFKGTVPNSDINTANTTASEVSKGSSALSSLTYLVDTLFLIAKVTILAPYYSALFLYQIGVHPVIASVWGVFNGVLYAMWIIDLRRNVPFLR
jgi:hypothetical protein